MPFSGIFVTVPDHGCVYTVCTEGELFYAPMYQNGTVNFEEFDVVDLMSLMGEEEYNQIVEIQNKLIDMMQHAGLYFKQPVLQ
jgi:hypothetical protein